MNKPQEIRFVADSMLGRLAKWLRVMGFDTYYRSFYELEEMEGLILDGRLLLSRSRRVIDMYPDSLFIRSDHVKDQLHEIRESGYLTVDTSRWFTRCLDCNTELQSTTPVNAREHIPEYVFHQNITSVCFCPLCGRFFWPGSHRSKMSSQLAEWEFTE
jgi:uncharacterized protein with PIN domain